MAEVAHTSLLHCQHQVVHAFPRSSSKSPYVVIEGGEDQGDDNMNEWMGVQDTYFCPGHIHLETDLRRFIGGALRSWDR